MSTTDAEGLLLAAAPHASDLHPPQSCRAKEKKKTQLDSAGAGRLSGARNP